MYCNGWADGHVAGPGRVSEAKSVDTHTVCVRPSVPGMKLPACVIELPASLAVS